MIIIMEVSMVKVSGANPIRGIMIMIMIMIIIMIIIIIINISIIIRSGPLAADAVRVLTDLMHCNYTNLER